MMGVKIIWFGRLNCRKKRKEPNEIRGEWAGKYNSSPFRLFSFLSAIKPRTLRMASADISHQRPTDEALWSLSGHLNLRTKFRKVSQRREVGLAGEVDRVSESERFRELENFECAVLVTAAFGFIGREK